MLHADPWDRPTLPTSPTLARIRNDESEDAFAARRLRARERALEHALGVEFQSGNRIDVLRNGDEIFPAMLGAIRRAKHFIGFVTFVYWHGDIAREFAGALAAAARRGVSVMVILDAVGAAAMSDRLIEEMRVAGVDVRWFRPKATWRLWRASHRTHRKVLVVDFEVGFTGGVGIAQEWCGNARNENEWRDTHLELHGPAVVGLWAAFSGNWTEGALDLPRGWNMGKEQGARGSARAMVVRSTAAYGFSEIAMLFRVLLALARRSFRVQTPYFVPDEASIDALRAAVGRGVRVTVLLPGPHVDSRVVSIASEPVVRRVVEAGVSVYEFQPTMMHAKVVLVDDDLSAVGSANFNSRSLHKDDEVMVVSSDRDLAARLGRHFERDLESSRLKRREDFEQLPWWRRALAALAAPLRGEM